MRVELQATPICDVSVMSLRLGNVEFFEGLFFFSGPSNRSKELNMELPEPEVTDSGVR